MTADVLSPAGRTALRVLAKMRAVLAFDLDGTLAPLVGQPAEAFVPSGTAARLHALTAHWPVAVLTGRAIDDARPRLGFQPHYLFGNHGAQRPGQSTNGEWNDALNGCRARLCQYAQALEDRGISVEDKGLSIALHYRTAANPDHARGWLRDQVADMAPGLLAGEGHCVLNLSPLGAPDKGDALSDVLLACGARAALVVGDDANDEPAFAKAVAPSVSVRVGPQGVSTDARFVLLSQGAMPDLLDHLLTLRR